MFRKTKMSTKAKDLRLMPRTVILALCVAIVGVYLTTIATNANTAEYTPAVQEQSGSIDSSNWVRQHPKASGWHLYSVSVVDSLHAWASGWHDSAAGLVVRTTDGGEYWTEVSRTLPQYLNDIHFVTDSLGWVVGGNNNQYSGFIRRTTDSGQLWSTQFSDPHNRFWSVFFLDDMRGWVCGDSGKILATTNRGLTWQEQASGRNMSLNDIFVLPSGVGWSGGGYGPATAFLRTTNFGASWDSVSNIKIDRLSFLSSSLGWAVTSYGAGFKWKTTDGGRTWIGGLFGMSFVFPIDVVMLNDSLVLATILDGRVDPPFNYYPISLCRLPNYLPPIETHAGILYGIEFANGRHGFAVGGDDIVSSNDSGQTWRNQAGPLKVTLNSIDMVDDSVGWVVGYGNLIMRTTDGGITWKSQTRVSQEALWAVASIDRQHAFAAGTVFLSTTDGGRTWRNFPLPENRAIFSLSFVNEHTGWAGSSTGKVFFTSDGGETWVPQVLPGAIWESDVDFVDSSYGWCIGPDGIFGTRNGGTTWSQQRSYADAEYSSIDFIDRNYGWASIFNLILKTTDGGTHWDTSLVSSDAGYTKTRFANRDTGWVVGELGRIVATTNGGASWVVQHVGGTSGEPNYYSIDAVSSRLVWVAGQSGEILHTTNGGGITSVDAIPSEHPTQLELEQNYPNPFNPVTTIRFSVGTYGHTSLRVFDLLGREVATLVNEGMQPGSYERVFNAEKLASGIYYCRLVAGGQSVARKMLLLK